MAVTVAAAVTVTAAATAAVATVVPSVTDLWDAPVGAVEGPAFANSESGTVNL